MFAVLNRTMWRIQGFLAEVRVSAAVVLRMLLASESRRLVNCLIKVDSLQPVKEFCATFSFFVWTQTSGGVLKSRAIRINEVVICFSSRYMDNQPCTVAVSPRPTGNSVFYDPVSCTENVTCVCAWEYLDITPQSTTNRPGAIVHCPASDQGEGKTDQ